MKYINRHRPKPTNQLQDYLFLTRTGDPLTGNRVETIIENYEQKAKVKGVRCSSHTFRHTFAISYLRNGGDVFSLPWILGHSTLNMVRNYVALTQSDPQAAHLKCSSVDNLRLKGGVNKKMIQPAPISKIDGQLFLWQEHQLQSLILNWTRDYGEKQQYDDLISTLIALSG